MTSKLFVYGTLMAPEVVNILLDRVPYNQKCRLIQMATTPSTVYRRHPVRSQVFPGMILANNNTTTTTTSESIPGILYRGLTVTEMKRLDYFESTEYEKKPCTVVVTEKDNQVEQAVTYIWTNPQSELVLEQEWSYEYFRDNHLQDYLNNTVIPCKMEMDRMTEFRS